MKIRSVILVVVTTFFFIQSCKSNPVLDEIRWFVNKVKDQNSISRNADSPYRVLVVYAYQDHSSGGEGFCFTVDYIMNSNDVRSIMPSHYFRLDDDYVLVKLGSGIHIENFEGIDLTKFTAHDDGTIKLVQKLYPSTLGGLTYSSSGMVSCWDGKTTHHTYYRDSDQIPLRQSIWADMSIDYEIQEVR